MSKENRKQLNDKNNRKKGAYKSITFIINNRNKERERERVVVVVVVVTAASNVSLRDEENHRMPGF